MCRRALDDLHDFGDADWAFGVGQRGEHQVRVIGHDYDSEKMELLAVSRQASVNDDFSHSFWQDPSTVSRERDEEGFVVGLKVRKLTPICLLAEHDEARLAS
jgi:hypothetical protein